MSLKYLNHRQLDLKIKSLVTNEREVLHEILLAVKEMDNRKGYLELGFPNLYAYLTEGVGYSAASAQRRIEGARLMREIPELSAKIQSGEVSLNQIAMVQKASRQVQKIRASQKGISTSVTAQEKHQILLSISGKDHATAQRDVAAFFELPVIESTVQKVQADDSVRLELTVSKELHEKIKQAQALLSHTLGDNDLTTYLTYVTERVIKQRTSVGTARNNPNVVSADFSARNKKIILKHDQHCQFEDPITKKRCSSTWFTQVDHIQGKANGGTGNDKNGQILCAGHNRLKYRREVGIRLR